VVVEVDLKVAVADIKYFYVMIKVFIFYLLFNI